MKELIELGFPPAKINIMKKTSRPLFMVIFENTKLNELKQKVLYLHYTRISWEHYINRNKITQCHNCQDWGHATTNCFANPVCLKCAEEHLTKDCAKSKDLPAKCANCGGPHPANSTDCEKYQKRLKWINKQRQKTTKPLFQSNNHTDCPKEIHNIQLHGQQEFPLLKKSQPQAPNILNQPVNKEHLHDATTKFIQQVNISQHTTNML